LTTRILLLSSFFVMRTHLFNSSPLPSSLPPSLPPSPQVACVNRAEFDRWVSALTSYLGPPTNPRAGGMGGGREGGRGEGGGDVLGMSGGGGGGRGRGALLPSVGGGRHGHRRHASSKDASVRPSVRPSLPPSGLPQAIGRIEEEEEGREGEEEEEEEEEEDGFEGVALLVLSNAACCWGRIVSFPVFVCLLCCLNVVGVNAWLRWRARGRKGGRKGGRKRVVGGEGGGEGGGVAAPGLGETQRRKNRGVSVVRALLFFPFPPSLPPCPFYHLIY